MIGNIVENGDVIERVEPKFVTSMKSDYSMVDGFDAIP